MSVKVVKNTRTLGRANVEGLSFPEAAIMTTLREMYHDVEARVREMNALTTGPATIKIIVEQEVIIDD